MSRNSIHNHQSARRFLSWQFILVAALMLLSILAGIVVASGKMKTAFLFVLPALILFLARLNERTRFLFLLFAIFLIPIQTSTFSSISLSEVMLSALVVAQLIFLNKERAFPFKLYHVPYLLFAVIGLFTAVIHNELSYWHIVSLVPLLLVLLFEKFIHTPDDAIRLITAALGAILGYLFIYWLGSKVGNGIRPNLGGLIGALNMTLGPIRYISHRDTFAALLAIGIPFTAYQLIKARMSITPRFFYGSILALFILLLGLSAVRGASIGAIIGMGLVLILSGRFRSPIVIVLLASLVIALIIWSPNIIHSIPALESSLERWKSSQWSSMSSIMSNQNLQYRINTLMFTIKGIKQNPLGYGYGYLWARYRIDEAIAYSGLLNGTGLAGFLCFILIVVQLLLRFIKSIFGVIADPQRDLAIIGLATLVCGLIIGVASESVLLGPVQSFIFWTILIAAECGTRLSINAK